MVGSCFSHCSKPVIRKCRTVALWKLKLARSVLQSVDPASDSRRQTGATRVTKRSPSLLEMHDRYGLYIGRVGRLNPKQTNDGFWPSTAQCGRRQDSTPMAVCVLPNVSVTQFAVVSTPSYCWDPVVHTSPTQYKNKYSLPTPPGSDEGSRAWAISRQSGLPFAMPSPTRRLISTGGRPERCHSQARFPNSRLDRSVRRQFLTEWPLGVRQPPPERHVIHSLD